MRILFDARRWVRRTTGIGQFIGGLLDALAQADRQNEYLIFYSEQQPRSTAQAENFHLRLCPIGLNSPAANIYFRNVAQEWRADVAYFPFWLMPLLMPCPSIVAIHDLLYSNFPQYIPWWRRISQDTYTAIAARRAARVHTLSLSSQRDLTRFLGLDPGKIDVVMPAVAEPDPIEGDNSGAAQPLAGLVTTPPFALYVGNHKPHKNLERLIRAYAEVQAQVESRLLIVGAKSSYSDPNALPYRDLAQNLTARGRIQFLGQVDEQQLRLLYRGARFLIFPSLHEGFGLPPLEAMQYGTPVACSNTSSLPEVVGDAALLFDPLQVAAISAAIIQLDRSPELRRRLATLGQARARQFSWTNSARKWLDSVERVARQ